MAKNGRDGVKWLAAGSELLKETGVVQNKKKWLEQRVEKA